MTATLERWEPPRVGSWVELLAPAAELAAKIADTDFVPDALRRKPAAICAAILYGAELGLGPMQSLAKIDVVKGRPAPRAELARALALAAGHDIWIEDQTNTRCTVAGQRSGSSRVQKVTWTLDDVKRAQISSPMYTKYPRQMLLARASAELVRAICPEVLGGIGRFAEEFDDIEMAPDGVGSAAASDTPAKSRRRRTPLTPVEQPALPDEPQPELEAEQPLVTDAQLRKIHALLNELGIIERDARLAHVENVIVRRIKSSKELTRDEASKVIDRLETDISDRATDDQPPLPDELPT